MGKDKYQQTLTPAQKRSVDRARQTEKRREQDAQRETEEMDRPDKDRR